uniref:Gem-associated protein 2 n=1 Tax=Romanomermis culicivorax TaxID=13658 RepID=A0A915KN91_ROMCU
MDQELIFVVSEQELEVVNLDQAPTSADQYLKQVMRSRKDYPLQQAQLNVTKIDANRQEVLANDQSSNITKVKFDPPRWWVNKQCADFSALREKFATKKLTKKTIIYSSDEVLIPDSNDEDGWREFMFEKCKVELQDIDDQSALSTKITNCYGPKGTPPLFHILAKMSQTDVKNALEFCCAWFCESIPDDGSADVESVKKFESNVVYIREITQWLFALTCALELLEPEPCSALRDLARQCLKLKEYSQNEHLRLVYDWFICIVAYYFEQKDLVV